MNNCPRCGKTFECRADDIQSCHCSAVRLSEEELAFLEARYDDCLCADCIQELKAEASTHEDRL